MLDRPYGAPESVNGLYIGKMYGRWVHGPALTFPPWGYLSPICIAEPWAR